MTPELTIHGHTHNGPRDSGGRIKGPREPLVQMLACDGYGGVCSITFDPDDAPRIAKAISLMGAAAAKGRKRKKIKITLIQPRVNRE